MNRKGFTLIELLIVVVIIGILAAIAIPKFANTKEKAYLASMKSDLRNLVTAEEAYFADSVKYSATIAPGEEFWMVMALVALEVGVFVVFGRHLVTRLVLRPLGQLTATADAVAAGDLDARAPDAETRDFATLAARLNRMTDHLLDARSQLVRSEKLASVGRLAAGIAHEVGNPLGAVGTYVEVLRRRGADPEVVAGLNRELDRIDHIVRSLLDYARPEEEPLDVVQPDEIVRGAFALLAAQGALKAVRASLELEPGVPQILGRAHLLEQAIVNLVLNAL